VIANAVILAYNVAAVADAANAVIAA